MDFFYANRATITKSEFIFRNKTNSIYQTQCGSFHCISGYKKTLRGPGMFEKVLLPTDFSGDARNLLACIGDIPGVHEVILLHIVDATHPPKGGRTHDQEIENARVILAENKAFLENLGLTVQIKIDVIVSMITQGDVPHAILETAMDENVSLIMMGARGKNPIQSILLGSVSASVIRQATTNVLLMRYPSEKGTGEKSWRGYAFPCGR